jgi:hypothetical protein
MCHVGHASACGDEFSRSRDRDFELETLTSAHTRDVLRRGGVQLISVQDFVCAHDAERARLGDSWWSHVFDTHEHARMYKGRDMACLESPAGTRTDSQRPGPATRGENGGVEAHSHDHKDCRGSHGANGGSDGSSGGRSKGHAHCGYKDCAEASRSRSDFGASAGKLLVLSSTTEATGNSVTAARCAHAVVGTHSPYVCCCTHVCDASQLAAQRSCRRVGHRSVLWNELYVCMCALCVCCIFAKAMRI